jgi:hypothetical protein
MSMLPDLLVISGGEARLGDTAQARCEEVVIWIV